MRPASYTIAPHPRDVQVVHLVEKGCMKYRISNALLKSSAITMTCGELSRAGSLCAECISAPPLLSLWDEKQTNLRVDDGVIKDG